MHFDHMSEIQNYEYLNDYLHAIMQQAHMSWDQVKAIFANYETFMSFNYGFYNTFMHAGYWGILGSIFVVALFVMRPEKPQPTTTRKEI